MKILGYHIDQFGITNSDGENCDNPPYLEYLLEPKPNTIRVFYHIGFNVANLLKIINISKEEGRVLLRDTEIYLPPYKLRYIPNKFLSIKKGNKFAYYSDVSQYKKFPNEDLKLDRKTLADKAQNIGQEVYNSLSDLGIEATSLTSPIRAYEKSVLEKIDIPTIDDIPEEAGMYAYECCKNNWVESFKIGYWEKTFDYDITTAYGSKIAQLADIRNGKWVEAKDDWWDYFYGYFKCKVTIISSFSPIIYIIKRNESNSRSYTPTGTWETYLTRQEIEFINEWRLGEVEIINGYGWELDPGKISKPLEQQIRFLDSEKERATGLKRDVIKRIPSGIYGKMLEQHPEDNEFGERFNPVWGAEIETPTRLDVAMLCLKYGVVPIHVAVDGVLLDTQIHTIPSTGKMGEWRENSKGRAISLGSGTVALEENKGYGDFTLDFDWLMKQIKENPEAEAYQLTKLSSITLAVAINENKWDKLGELLPTTKTVDVGYEEKRYYKEMPSCGRELLSRVYESEPWDVATLFGKEYAG